MGVSVGMGLGGCHNVQMLEMWVGASDEEVIM